MLQGVFLVLGMLGLNDSPRPESPLQPPDSMAMQLIARLPCFGPYVFPCGDADHDGHREFYAIDYWWATLRVVEHEVADSFQVHEVPVEAAVLWELGDADRDGLAELVRQEAGDMLIYEARDSWSFPDSLVWSTSVGTARGHGSWYGDFDRDTITGIITRHGDSTMCAVYECVGDNQYELSYWLSRNTSGMSANTRRALANDMDRDGVPELVAGSLDGWVHFYEAEAPDSLIMQASKYLHPGRAFGVAAAQDMDRDGLPEAIITGGSSSGYSRVWVMEAPEDNSFEVVWQADFEGNDFFEPTVTAGDVDGDSVSEFALTNGAYVRLFRCVGDNDYEVMWAGECRKPAVRLYDINSDGRDELIYSPNYEETLIWEYLPVGIEERERRMLDAVQILPSLVARGGAVRMTGLLPDMTVQVLDASGRVAHGSESEVPLTSGLPAGAYFVRLSSAGVSVHKKLLVLP